jgi:undecaprenyl-diphosphatase
MASFLTRIDQGDRALFVRFSLSDRSSMRVLRVWKGLTHLGGAPAAIAASIVPQAWPGSWRTASTRTLAVLIVSHLVVQGIKRAVGRPRPPGSEGAASLISAPDRFSFPSGHAAAAMAVAIGLGTAMPGLAPLLIALAGLVGVSRVALGVHYPGDVLAGQAIAVLTAVAIGAFA